MVVATVCLLETSRHGLLETELLQMLAEETTLTPPPYVEGESDQITVTKAEETSAGLLLLKDSLPSGIRGFFLRSRMTGYTSGSPAGQEKLTPNGLAPVVRRVDN